MLKVTNIQKSFNGHHVLKGIDFEIDKDDGSIKMVEKMDPDS